jgi:hypothetical protein
MRGRLVINSISATVDGSNPSLRKEAEVGWIVFARVVALLHISCKREADRELWGTIGGVMKKCLYENPVITSSYIVSCVGATTKHCAGY